MRRREFLGVLSGAATAWPLAARAQQAGKIPTVAYLWHAGNKDEEEPYFGAIREGFAKLGYIEGRNLKLIHRFPNEEPKRFQSMAAELVSMNVDVLMGGGASAPKPGSNATGLSNFGRDTSLASVCNCSKTWCLGCHV